MRFISVFSYSILPVKIILDAWWQCIVLSPFYAGHVSNYIYPEFVVYLKVKLQSTRSTECRMSVFVMAQTLCETCASCIWGVRWSSKIHDRIVGFHQVTTKSVGMGDKLFTVKFVLLCLFQEMQEMRSRSRSPRNRRRLAIHEVRR